MARRRLVSLVAAGLLALATALVATSGAAIAKQAGDREVTLCHASGNHYVQEVGVKIIWPGILLDDWHSIHPRDIIPPYDYFIGLGQWYHFPGQHWTTQGQAIWNNDCQEPKPTDAPTDAPVPPSDPNTTTCGTVGFTGVPEGWYLVIEPGDLMVTSGFGSIKLDPGVFTYGFRDAGANDKVSGTFTVGVCATATSTPFETQAGETATAVSSLPPTNTGGSGPLGSTPIFALLICLAFGGLGLTAVEAQRRTIRR
jgi:hypothetical protein